MENPDLPEFWVLENSVEKIHPSPYNFNRTFPDSPLYIGVPYALNDQTFHLAMVPREPTYSGPFFSALSYTFTTLPIRRKSEREGEDRYVLDKTAVHKWHALEECITVLINEISRYADVTFPLDYDPGSDYRPFKYKYGNSFRSEMHLRKEADLARNAFTVQLAMVSYLIAHAWSEGRDALLALRSRTRLSIDFIEAVRRSWVANWSVPRVGCYINPYNVPTSSNKHQWHNSAHVMYNRGCVPFWIWYGIRDRSKPLDGIHVPLFQELQPSEIEEWNAKQDLIPQQPAAAPEIPQAAPAPQFPQAAPAPQAPQALPAPQAPRQNDSLSFYDWINQQQERNKRHEDKETHPQRMQLASSANVPKLGSQCLERTGCLSGPGSTMRRQANGSGRGSSDQTV